MIKQLIKDIAFDKIEISQALTRAKLIANQIKNENFSNWVNKELVGYEFDDQSLPSYRKIWSNIFLIAEFPNGQTQSISVNLPDSVGDKILDMVNNHRIIESIEAVENQIENLGDKAKGYIRLPIQQTEILGNFYQDQIMRHRGVITNANREIGKVQYQNVLGQTKQRLLDTLMQLDNEFPDLVDNYQMTKENNNKVQHIVNNHIYGNNNPTNIGIGDNFQQSISSNQLSQTDRDLLADYGVENAEIEELDEIIKNTKQDKPKFMDKVMKWLGSVSASIAAKGLAEKIPQLAEFVHHLF